jgi:Ca-activated chloride channel family protein
MRKWIIALVLGTVVAAVSPVNAAGLIIVDETHWWPGPIPPGPMPPRPIPPPRPPRAHVFAPLEVGYVKVNTRIDDQVARTSIDQEFYNPNHARLEGTFIFPIPKGAQLDRFTMDIDGKPAEAELLTAGKARQIYEDIVRKSRDPALLEYAGRDLYRIRIFPIEPNSRKRITLSYTQLLKSEDGLASYQVPLSAEKYSAKAIRNVSVKVELETKRPLKSIYSPSHAVEIKRHSPTKATAGYEAAEVKPDEDFTLYFAAEKDEIGFHLITRRTSGEDGYFLLLASPGMDVKDQQVVMKDVVFVLDTSGSMAGRKLEQAKKALQFCVENLNENDRFEILRFSTEVEPLFDKLVDAGRQNRARAEEFIKDLKPTGGTAIDDALKKALSFNPPGSAGSARLFVVIFLTDGRPTIGTTDEEQILAGVKKANERRNRVFCFGIGTDVNTHLLDRITEETRGASQYVLPEEDLEVKVSNFFAKIKAPVLANPLLAFTGGIRATKLYPSPLPDLFKGEQLVLVGRYSGSGDSAIVLEGVANGVSRKLTFEVKFPDSSSGGDFIPRLWATRRVGYLLDEIRLRGENSELREEVTELARAYGIVTPYTAYLILEDEARREVPAPMRSLQEFERDRGAREQAADTWRRFKTERSGEGAVAGARYGMSLRSADAPPAAAAGGAFESQRALGLSPTTMAAGPAQPADASRARLLQYSQQTRFVAGKNFFQNGDEWIDAAVQKAPDAKRVRVQFGSPDYFDLLSRHPNAAPWLALGRNVQFVLNDAVYEIHE